MTYRFFLGVNSNLVATAMLNLANNTVLDSSSSSNNSQALLVEILFGGAEVTNKDVNSQVIVCLDDCVCGKNTVSDELIEVPPVFLE